MSPLRGDGLAITTFDASQGAHYDVVIRDLLIMPLADHRGAGFLNVRNRLNVAYSRARIGIYIIATKSNIIHPKALGKLKNAILKLGSEKPVKGPSRADTSTRWTSVSWPATSPPRSVAHPRLNTTTVVQPRRSRMATTVQGDRTM
jgi:hypothetical protein